MKKIRVMVVDDSALMRKLISDILSKDPAIEVVTTAMDGLFALKKIPQVKPDVITLDLDMPRMDGLTALRYIVHDHQIPVILVSSLTTTGGNLALEGLAIGAVDFVTKPADAISAHIQEIARELIQKVKVASTVTVGRVPHAALPPPAPEQVLEKRSRSEVLTKIVAIGISTGGPNAISMILPQLPADFGAAILIVQVEPVMQDQGEGSRRGRPDRTGSCAHCARQQASQDRKVEQAWRRRPVGKSGRERPPSVGRRAL